ncbi:hypothetical protein [Soonwooa purpurea]
MEGEEANVRGLEGPGKGKEGITGTANKPKEIEGVTITNIKPLKQQNPATFNILPGSEGAYINLPTYKLPPLPINICGHCNDGPVKMIGGPGDWTGFFEILGMLLSNEESNLKYVAIPLLVVKGKEDKALKILAAEKGVFTATKEGVILPKGLNIPKEYIQSPYRSSSYGKMENGKFKEYLRVDPATPTGMKGPERSHFHIDGTKEHIFDISRWPNK